MRNFDNTSSNTCQSGYSAQLESSLVSSSGDDAMNTTKRKSKFLSFTKICTFSLLMTMSQCYENANSNSSLCTFSGHNNGEGLRSLRMLASAESKEDQFESATVENEYEEDTQVQKEKKKCKASSPSSSPQSDAVDKTCPTDCGACTCGFKTLDLYFEKKLFDILDAGNKKAQAVVDSGTHIMNGLKNYLKYVLLFSPLLLEFLASKLLVSGHYKTSQFISSVCVTFYLYVFYKIMERYALERDAYLDYEYYSPRKGASRSRCSGSNCEASCGKNACPGSNCERSCNKKSDSCSKK